MRMRSGFIAFLGLLFDVKGESPSILTHSSEECKNETSTNLVCNFTDAMENKNVIISDRANLPSTKLIIINASTVQIHDSPIGYSNISIFRSKGISSGRTTSNTLGKYDLYLIDSSATTIDENIKYFKARNSIIDTLKLLHVDEFDVVSSRIEVFFAKVSSRSPSIYHSYVETLSIVANSESRLTIDNTTIQSLQRLEFNSAKEGTISNSNINNIQKQGVNINSGTLTIRNSILTSLQSESFVINDGTLEFDNVTYNLNPDSVVLKPEGQFSWKRYDVQGSYYTKFKIDKGWLNDSFTPFSTLRLDSDSYIIIIVLGSLCAITFCIFIIALIITICRKLKRNNKGETAQYSMEIMEGQENIRNSETNVDKMPPREYEQSSNFTSMFESHSERPIFIGDANEKTRLGESANNSLENREPDVSNAQQTPKVLFDFGHREQENANQGRNNFGNSDVYHENSVNEDPMEEYSEPDVFKPFSPRCNIDVECTSPEEEIYSENENPTNTVADIKQKLMHNIVKPDPPVRKLDAMNKPTVKRKPDLPLKEKTNISNAFDTGPISPNPSFLSSNMNNLLAYSPTKFDVPPKTKPISPFKPYTPSNFIPPKGPQPEHINQEEDEGENMYEEFDGTLDNYS